MKGISEKVAARFRTHRGGLATLAVGGAAVVGGANEVATGIGTKEVGERLRVMGRWL